SNIYFCLAEKARMHLINAYIYIQKFLHNNTNAPTIDARILVAASLSLTQQFLGEPAQGEEVKKIQSETAKIFEVDFKNVCDLENDIKATLHNQMNITL